VYYILEGRGKMELADEVVETEPGMVIYVEPGTPHRRWSAEGAEGEGFEPSNTFVLPVFKTGAIGHSATPPATGRGGSPHHNLQLFLREGLRRLRRIERASSPAAASLTAVENRLSVLD
jgi:hypothetical protein